MMTVPKTQLEYTHKEQRNKGRPLRMEQALMPMPSSELTYAFAIYPIPQHPYTTEHLRQYFSLVGLHCWWVG
jgi:hypothetical protein